MNIQLLYTIALACFMNISLQSGRYIIVIITWLLEYEQSDWSVGVQYSPVLVVILIDTGRQGYKLPALTE